MSVLFVLMFFAFVYMVALGSSNNNTKKEHNDKSNKETEPKRKTIEKQAKIAELLIDDCCEKTYGAKKYKIETSIKKNNASVRLNTNMPASAVQEGIVDPKEWNNLIDAMTRFYNEINNTLKKLGCEDVIVSFIVGDLSLDTVYLVMINGKVVYDYVNNINYK